MDPRRTFAAAFAASALLGFLLRGLAGAGALHLGFLVAATLAALAAAAVAAMMLSISMGVQSDDLRRRALRILAGALGAIAIWLSRVPAS